MEIKYSRTLVKAFNKKLEQYLKYHKKQEVWRIQYFDYFVHNDIIDQFIKIIKYHFVIFDVLID